MNNNYDIRSEIEELTEIILDLDERKVAYKIIDYYLNSKNREIAVMVLRSIVPRRPKRPLYYINYEVKYLNRNSRWVVENIGSYLDLLVKELRFEVEGTYHKFPLGRNISYLIKSKLDKNIKKLSIKYPC